MKRILSILFIGTLISLYYIGLGVYQFNLGFRYLEPLFISDKIQLLFSNEVKTLELFYFTYPILSQIIATPTTILSGPILAPLVSSSIFTGILGAYIIRKFYEMEHRFLSVLTSIYFLCSPLMIAIATSGTSLYLYYTLYFLVFHFIFRYIRDFTTYNLVLLSISLTCFVFLDYEFLWIVVLMLPLVFFFSLFQNSYGNLSYLSIFSKLSQNFTETKKLIGRSFSTILVILFTPLMSLVFYFIINFWFTEDPMYFNRSETAQWNQQKFLEFLFFNQSGTDIKNSTNFNGLLWSIGSLTPIFCIMFLIGRKKLLFQFSLLLVPVWIFYCFQKNGAGALDLTVLLIIVASGVAAILHLFQTKLQKSFRNTELLIPSSIILFLFLMLGEYNYFSTSKHHEEKNMFAFYSLKKPLNTSSFEQMNEFISENINQKTIILTDNTYTYPITALTRNKIEYYDQFEKNYYNALQRPELYCDYLLISKPRLNSHPHNKLEHKILRDSVAYELIFSTEDFELLKLY